MRIRVSLIFIISFSLLFLNSCIYKSSKVYGYNKVLKKDTITSYVMKINAPMFILKPIIRNELKNEKNSNELIALLDKVRDIKISITEGTPNRLQLLKNNPKSLGPNFVEWFSIKSDDQQVSLRTKGKIKKLELLINSPESSVLLHLKGKFTTNDIVQLINLSAAKEF